MPEIKTVGSKLLDEIERVSAKRERWRIFSRERGCSTAVAPAILLMTEAINAAKEAVQSDDPAFAIRALKALEDFDDND